MVLVSKLNANSARVVGHGGHSSQVAPMSSHGTYSYMHYVGRFDETFCPYGAKPKDRALRFRV